MTYWRDLVWRDLVDWVRLRQWREPEPSGPHRGRCREEWCERNARYDRHHDSLSSWCRYHGKDREWDGW